MLQSDRIDAVAAAAIAIIKAVALNGSAILEVRYGVFRLALSKAVVEQKNTGPSRAKGGRY